MVTLKIIRRSDDKYKIKVNGRKIRINDTVEDSLGYVANDFVELEPTENFEIVIKRKLISVIICFFVNLMAFVALISKECGWQKVINSVKYSIENPEKADGEIIIRLNQGVYNRNSIFVSEGFILRD